MGFQNFLLNKVRLSSLFENGKPWYPILTAVVTYWSPHLGYSFLKVKVFTAQWRPTPRDPMDCSGLESKELMKYSKLCSEKAMAPHSSTVAWKIPMDRGTW